MKNVFVALAAASTFTSSVSAHGFLFGIGRLSPQQNGQVRNINKINVEIDSLRNPSNGQPLCRGAPRGTPVDLQLSNGGSLTLTQALSVGAQHIGGCAVEILDAANPNNKVTLTSGAECATQGIVGFDTNKGSASSQCSGKIPKGLVTDDMCLGYWTFKTENVDKITCTDCILRWTWRGEHISKTNPELYENCIDVRVNKNGGGSNPAPPPTKPAEPRPTTSAPAPAPAPTNNNGGGPGNNNNGGSGGGLGTVTPPKSDSKLPVSSFGCNANRYMACEQDGSNSFLVCFPDQSRQPTQMACAPGTTCKPFGNYIQCI